MPKNPTCLILTVGTGTQGKYSNLAQGLANTIQISPPGPASGWCPAIRPIPSRWQN